MWALRKLNIEEIHDILYSTKFVTAQNVYDEERKTGNSEILENI